MKLRQRQTENMERRPVSANNHSHHIPWYRKLPQDMNKMYLWCSLQGVWENTGNAKPHTRMEIGDANWRYRQTLLISLPWRRRRDHVNNNAGHNHTRTHISILSSVQANGNMSNQIGSLSLRAKWRSEKSLLLFHQFVWRDICVNTIGQRLVNVLCKVLGRCLMWISKARRNLPCQQHDNRTEHPSSRENGFRGGIEFIFRFHVFCHAWANVRHGTYPFVTVAGGFDL